MFYDRDNVHHRFLFSFQSLYEQCAFCIVPTALLSFYENKQKVLDCRHLLCAFIGRSLALSVCVCVFFSSPSLSSPTWQTCQVRRAPKWIRQWQI